MNVLMPLLATGLAAAFPLLRAGGPGPYVVSLLVTAALLAIVFVPVVETSRL